MPESPRDAADAVRDYVKGIERPEVSRQALAVLMAVTVILSIAAVPYSVGIVEAVTLSTIDDFEDNDKNIEASGWSGWSGSIGSGSFTVTSSSINGDYSAELTQTDNNVASGIEATRDSSTTAITRVEWRVVVDSLDSSETWPIRFRGLDSDGNPIYDVIFDGDGSIIAHTGEGQTDSGSDISTGTVYNVTVYNLDYSSETYDYKVTRTSDGTVIADETSIDMWTSVNQDNFKTIRFQIGDKDSGTTTYRFDDVKVDDSNLLHNVTGTIKDNNGNGIANAEVTVNTSDESDTASLSGIYGLELPNGTHKITATKSGYRSNSTVVTVSGSDITGEDIVLTEAQNVSGSVTEAGTSGPLNGLGNITISTNRSDQTATTATDGTGDYTIQLEANATHNITASSPNWFNETITVEINDSDKTGIDFALEDLHAHISGQVTSNETGDVLEDVLVESNTTTANATTNNNGFYEFQIEPGKNIITASKSGFTDDTLTVWVNETTVSKNDHDLTDRDLVLGEANYTVNGTVSSSDGGALENINITVVGEGVTTDTDANGDWNVSLPDGNYTIKAHHPHHFNESQSVTVDGGNVTGVDFTLDPVHAHLSGTVTYAKTGNPIEGALVTSNTTTANDTTDANGDYAFEIDRGVNNITASKSSYNDGSITVVVDKSTVSKNDHTLNNRDIQLTEPEDFIVSGQVTHVSTGDGVADVTVSTNLSDTTATTDSDGNYQLALDNGTRKLTFSKDKFKDNTTTVTVNGGDVTGVDVTLVEIIELQLKVPSHMWANTSEGYEVWDVAGDTDVEITDKATVTSSDPTNLTVYESNNTLVATSDVTFSGTITITANYSDKSVSRDVTIANKSVENVDKFQNAADMFAGLWGDPVNPNTGERKGGDQLTMRVLFIAVLLGAAIVPLASAFAGIGMTTLVVAMGWFMGWVGDGMALVTVFTGLFIGLNVAANIDYSVRR